MWKVTRRSVVLGTVAISMDCMTQPLAAAALSVTHPPPAPRSPGLGQSWRYARHDGITGQIINVQVDRISAIDDTITIESSTEAASSDRGVRSWGGKWLHPVEPAASRPPRLPSEVQERWGMIIVDPHWDLVQVYQRPIPLWPTQLHAGWRSLVNTQYQTAEAAELPWQQTMRAHGWESITVPAGQFMALRYTNLINFRHSDFSRTDAVRRETLWFAPEVGRWVVRESSGSYYHDDSVGDQAYIENSYRWELLNWS